MNSRLPIGWRRTVRRTMMRSYLCRRPRFHLLFSWHRFHLFPYYYCLASLSSVLVFNFFGRILYFRREQQEGNPIKQINHRDHHQRIKETLDSTPVITNDSTKVIDGLTSSEKDRFVDSIWFVHYWHRLVGGHAPRIYSDSNRIFKESGRYNT